MLILAPNQGAAIPCRSLEQKNTKSSSFGGCGPFAGRVMLCLMIAASESGYGGVEAEVSTVVVPGSGAAAEARRALEGLGDLLPTERKSTRLNSSHANISYAVFCLKKKK